MARHGHRARSTQLSFLSEFVAQAHGRIQYCQIFEVVTQEASISGEQAIRMNLGMGGNEKIGDDAARPTAPSEIASEVGTSQRRAGP